MVIGWYSMSSHRYVGLGIAIVSGSEGAIGKYFQIKLKKPLSDRCGSLCNWPGRCLALTLPKELKMIINDLTHATRSEDCIQWAANTERGLM